MRLQESYLGAYPGVGTFHSCGKNQHLGAYPGVGACPGDYSIYIVDHSYVFPLSEHCDSSLPTFLLQSIIDQNGSNSTTEHDVPANLEATTPSHIHVRKEL